jgi:TolB-like protein
VATILGKSESIRYWGADLDNIIYRQHPGAGLADAINNIDNLRSLLCNINTYNINTMQYQFDEFTLDTEHLELFKGAKALHCEPQVIQLLVLLVENHDRTVSKEEINQVIWHGRIVSEAALSSRVKMLRQLMGDDGRTQRFIRTVHKRGFRFVAAIAPAVNTDSETSPAQPGTEPSLAIKSAVMVLPFSNLSSESGYEYLSDGITTDIITHLAKHRWLDVVARNTAFGFKGAAVDICDIGTELNVGYVVEGSVQRAANRVRITVNLIDAGNAHSVWTERYDREIEDIFALQDEITEKIVARLEPEIGYAERNRVMRSHPTNLQAWDCFHMGVYHFYQFTGESNKEAQRLLRQSFEMDQRFGNAYAWWAYAVVLGMVYWDTPPTQALLDEALTACDQALSLDRQNATFYALRARVLLARGEYDLAIAENNIEPHFSGGTLCPG